MSEQTCLSCGKIAHVRTYDQLTRCPACGQRMFDVRQCARCSETLPCDRGVFVHLEKVSTQQTPVWVCMPCYREVEKLKPQLKTWVPLAVIILILGVGVLVAEFIATSLVALWQVIF